MPIIRKKSPKVKEIKRCYVCCKGLGFSKLIYNPQVNTKWWRGPERYVCLPTTENSLCHSVLRQLADDGSCLRPCCATGKISRFDIEDCIKMVKNNCYLPEY